MEIRAGAHMGKKESKWDRGSCSPKKIYRIRARYLKFCTATAKSSRLATAATAAATTTTTTEEVDRYNDFNILLLCTSDKLILKTIAEELFFPIYLYNIGFVT